MRYSVLLFAPTLLVTSPARSLAQERDNASWWTAAGVIGAVGAATLLDRGFNAWIQNHRSRGGDAVARAFRNGGEPMVVYGIGGGIVAAGVIAGEPALRRRGGRVLLSVATAGLTSLTIKELAGRVRPAQTTNPYVFKPFSDNDAFPSGHTTLAFALATSLAEGIDNRWASVALYAGATGTAWSRINDQRHWLSDVLAGAAVGITAARLIERYPPRFLADANGARLEWRIAF